MSSQEFQGFFPSSRQVAFEQNWAERHDVPAESLAQYRQAGRLVTTLAKSMHNAYVKAIEAAGAKVVIQ